MGGPNDRGDGNIVVASDDSDDKLEMTPKTEDDVEREQPGPSQVDSLVQQMSQASVNDDLAPTETQVDNLAQQVSQVVLKDADPGNASPLQKEATKMPLATPSTPSSGRTWDLLLNHKNPNKGVVLRRRVNRPEGYLKAVRAKEQNPNVECLKFPTGQADELLRTIGMCVPEEKLTHTWWREDASQVWRAAEDFHTGCETKLRTSAHVQTPAANSPPPQYSELKLPAMMGVNPLAERVE
ncbi:hypothetical protein HDU77_010518 [Chytriomyces hyalinus]|nr:hypothetical protein HDU77_010518 [Chytriomyces hyalinus]